MFEGSAKCRIKYAMLANLMNASRLLWRAFVFLAACGSFASCRTPPDAAVTPELVERNNRAVGLMGQFDFTAAVDAFAAIQSAVPDWPEGRCEPRHRLDESAGEGDAARAEHSARARRHTGRRPPRSLRARFAVGTRRTIG